MEMYTLNSLLLREEIIDRAKSMIWTERYNALGDFQLEVIRTPDMERLLVEGTFLAMNMSDRVMEIETVEKRDTIKVAGRSIEKIMMDRASFWQKGAMDGPGDDKWPQTGTPGTIARNLWDFCCAAGLLDIKNKLPFVELGTRYPVDTLIEPTVVVNVELEPKDLFTHMQEICVPWDLGFRLVRDLGLASRLYFDVYYGIDRTTDQTEYDPVIFSPSLDNMFETTEFKSISDLKTVALVYSKLGFAEVFADGSDPDADGFERRELVVVDSSVTEDNPDIPGALQRVGLEALAGKQKFWGFDGEISQKSQYRYGIDYNMGDLVEMRADNGGTNKMRVTEQIFVSDAEGERAYPTLTLFSSSQPGVWTDFRYNKAWNEMADTEFWNTQPT